MRTKVSIDIDKAGGTKEIQHWADEALTDYRDEIIRDMNIMVPVKGGKNHNGGGGSLQKSAGVHSDQRAKDGVLTIRWDTPYARYQHEGKVMHGTPPRSPGDYGPDTLSYTSNTARAEWTKHAQDVYGEKWRRDIQKMIGGR